MHACMYDFDRNRKCNDESPALFPNVHSVPFPTSERPIQYSKCMMPSTPGPSYSATNSSSLQPAQLFQKKKKKI